LTSNYNAGAAWIHIKGGASKSSRLFDRWSFSYILAEQNEELVDEKNMVWWQTGTLPTVEFDWYPAKQPCIADG
jgi:hypothetical protein